MKLRLKSWRSHWAQTVSLSGEDAGSGPAQKPVCTCQAWNANMCHFPLSIRFYITTRGCHLKLRLYKVYSWSCEQRNVFLKRSFMVRMFEAVEVQPEENYRLLRGWYVKAGRQNSSASKLQLNKCISKAGTPAVEHGTLKLWNKLSKMKLVEQASDMPQRCSRDLSVAFLSTILS